MKRHYVTAEQQQKPFASNMKTILKALLNRKSFFPNNKLEGR